jgi:hypothetical protein
MAPSPNRRELVLDHGRVFVEVPLLMTDDELAGVFEAFVKEVRGRPPKGPAEPPKGSPLPPLPRRDPKKPGILSQMRPKSNLPPFRSRKPK